MSFDTLLALGIIVLTLFVFTMIFLIIWIHSEEKKYDKSYKDITESVKKDCKKP